jgi:hypothetical protein
VEHPRRRIDADGRRVVDFTRSNLCPRLQRPCSSAAPAEKAARASVHHPTTRVDSVRTLLLQRKLGTPESKAARAMPHGGYVVIDSRSPTAPLLCGGSSRERLPTRSFSLLALPSVALQRQPFRDRADSGSRQILTLDAPPSLVQVPLGAVDDRAALLAEDEGSWSGSLAGSPASCAGDSGAPTQEARGDATIIRCRERHRRRRWAVIPFDRGALERAVHLAGFQPPVGVLPGARHPGYHSSADDLQLVRLSSSQIPFSGASRSST